MKISLKDFDLICCLCLNKDNCLTCLLQDNIIKLLNNLGIILKTKEELPQKLCSKCEESIKGIFAFIDQCRSSYDTLEKILLNEKAIKKESETYDDEVYDNYEYKQEIEFARVNNKTEIETIITSLNTENIECKPDLTSIKKETDSDKIVRKLYQCKYCMKEFNLKNSFNNHTCKHHVKLGLLQKKSKCTENKEGSELRCDECKKVFASKIWFDRHKLKHEGKDLPQKHKVTLNKNIRPFLCDYCAMSFYIKANLDTHLRVHTGERPYKCNQCNKRFKVKTVLERHNLNHLEIRPKPYECDICQKRFTTKANRDIHRRVHTGEKPYRCDFCGKNFNYKTQWKIHIRMHTGEYPYSCSVCNTSFRDNSNLRRHQRKKGHLQTQKDVKESEIN